MQKALKTWRAINSNLNIFVREGDVTDDIVCRCPWVSYLSRTVTRENALSHELVQKKKVIDLHSALHFERLLLDSLEELLMPGIPMEEGLLFIRGSIAIRWR